VQVKNTPIVSGGGFSFAVRYLFRRSLFCSY
jgi:hypothetical protein